MPKKKTTSKKSGPKPPKSLYHHYRHQRNSFFESHPNSRLLLGLLVVAFALFVAQYYWNFQLQTAIGMVLAEEGINYVPSP